ncbi:MAG TPA: urease accessory protein UreF [Leptolyngbyaceae cyanobacterium M33_DOE_097]|uniref:Urease accessory protein UreF n=1 Tax=Oscillatoriales cyanobacterium SpSt-418 TaxID=2282169 RepID=A0A7C3PDW8_9CYAN|nr:urease accessory protein UreF [Leptolyngbyaceae cyanobacterium M33_DOE_097]
MNDDSALLRLFQLTSPALPVGAYSYSEGLEYLVHQGQLPNAAALQEWLHDELMLGAIRMDAAVMVRAYQAIQAQDWETVLRWNRWLSATREAEELRLQNWQMGRSLLRLLEGLTPDPALPQSFPPSLIETLLKEGCNFAIAYAVIATSWQITGFVTLLGYLHSWAANQISAGIKLIPLGQTAGQQLLLDLNPSVHQAALQIWDLPDDSLESCSWGLTLAAMGHETQYSRLFRS